MTLRRLLAVASFGILFIGLSLASPAAQAQDDAGHEDPEPEVSDQPPDVFERMLAIQVTGGLDTPFGVIGGALEFAPVRYLVIYAGGGVSRSGGRVAGGLRLQYPIGNAAVALFGGVGGGPMDWESGGQTEAQTARQWDFALFLHSGLSFEYRWDVGLFGRLDLGVEGVMTPEADRCTFSGGGECGPSASGLAKPLRGWAGLTIGYALDL